MPTTSDPTPPRLYRGWLMVLVAAVAMVATLPGRTHGLGMITERLIADDSLDLDRTTFGHLNLWATLIGALFCLGCGRLIDRFGCRRVLTIVVLLLAGVVLAMTRLAALVPLFVAITLTRGFGQSALSVVSITIVGKWFHRRLSWAMAVYAVTMALGFVAAALIAREYADADWRVVWGGMGVALLFGVAPLSWLLTRDDPESCGLVVDGGPPSAKSTATTADAGETSPVDETEYTLGEALATPAFWVFGLCVSLFGLVASGVSLFNESILVDRGFSKETYYEALAMGTLAGLGGKFLAGWLTERWSLRRTTALAMTLLAGALVFLTRLRGYDQLVIFVVANAVAGGAITVVFFTVWGRLYGRGHLGRIQGVAQMLTVLASAVGPLLFAECRARTGSYDPALLTSALAIATLGLAAWLVPLPAMSTIPEPTPALEPRT